MAFLCFLLSILISYILNPISSFAVVPPIIPDSVNTNQIYSGSFDPEYPNKEFVPNDPSGVSCEFEISEEQDVGTSGPKPSGPVIIDKRLSNEKVDYDNRITGSLYTKTQCAPGPSYDECIWNRDNSMDVQNNYGASSTVQRSLPQTVKNKLYCQRWHSGILSGAHVAETDERVGCYCGGDDYTVNADCTSSCRDVYFSELVFFNTDFCDVPSDIATYYNCASGTCPIKKREPAFSSLISPFVAKRLLREASLVAKGSAASRITQVEANKSTIAAIPNLMAPSTDNSIYAIRTVFPQNSPPNTSNPSCSPVTKTAGPDEYRLDFLAAIKAFFNDVGNKLSGNTTIKQEFSTNTVTGLRTIDGLSSLVPASEQQKSPPPQTEHAVTSNNGENILVPGTRSNEYLRQNLTPQSWKHL